MAGLNEIIPGLFAASTVVIFVYALLCLISVGMSLFIIFHGRNEFSRGHMRRFVNAFAVTLAISFLYAIWNIITRLKVINIGNSILGGMIDNILLIVFIMLLTYIAYLAREISSRFGFRSIGKKVSELAKK